MNTPTLKNREQSYQLENDAAWQEIRRCTPRYLHNKIKKQVRDAIAGVESKELSKSVYVHLIEPIRLALLEIGHRLAQQDIINNANDVFHCAQSELDTIMQDHWNGKALRTLIVERKSLKLKQEQLPAPDIIFDETPQQLTISAVSKGTGLRGIGVALGVANGTARLIKTPDEGALLQNGDVLVAPSTDPAWTPLFLKASAIVMETGGYLSHGSIVAREYGIPAVVNIAGIFNALNDGDRLTVNGNQGIVEVVG